MYVTTMMMMMMYSPSNAGCHGRRISEATTSRRRGGAEVETVSIGRRRSDPVCSWRTQHQQPVSRLHGYRSMDDSNSGTTV